MYVWSLCRAELSSGSGSRSLGLDDEELDLMRLLITFMSEACFSFMMCQSRGFIVKKIGVYGARFIKN